MTEPAAVGPDNNPNEDLVRKILEHECTDDCMKVASDERED